MSVLRFAWCARVVIVCVVSTRQTTRARAVVNSKNHGSPSGSHDKSRCLSCSGNRSRTRRRSAIRSFSSVKRHVARLQVRQRIRLAARGDPCGVDTFQTFFVFTPPGISCSLPRGFSSNWYVTVQVWKCVSFRSGMTNVTDGYARNYSGRPLKRFERTVGRCTRRSWKNGGGGGRWKVLEKKRK